MKELECRARYTLAGVSAAIDSARVFLEQSGAPPSGMFDVELALEELLVNAVRHSGLPEDTEDIALRLVLAEDEIHILIDAPGTAFDSTQGPPPDLDLPVEERKIGGLGLHLVRAKARRMRYERRGAVNHLELWFALNPAAEG